MKRVCILDYGSGNVRSVLNLIASIEGNVVISHDAGEIKRASHIVLPGVGAFASTMRKMRETLPMDGLEQAALVEKKPFLGICVGMQVMATRGVEFGEHAGLGWVPGTVEHLKADNLPLPHVGWNNVTCRRSSPLLAGFENGADFYFVHSFAFHVDPQEHVVATTEYGNEFCSVVQRENLFGVQFHPEKSQRAGLRLMKNFLSLS